MNCLKKTEEQTDNLFRNFASIENFEENIKIDDNLSVFDARCALARELGFLEVNIDTVLEDFSENFKTKSDATFSIQKKHFEKEQFDYFYDHTTDEIFRGAECLWAVQPFYAAEQDVVKSWIPLLKKTVHHKVLKFGPFNKLKKELSYKAYRRIEKTKKLRLFNCFFAIGHMEVWKTNKTKQKPTILACILEVHSDSGKKAAYFHIN